MIYAVVMKANLITNSFYSKLRIQSKTGRNKLIKDSTHIAIREQHQYSTVLSDYLLTLQVIVTSHTDPYPASSDWSV